MKALIVEDDFLSRLSLQKTLSPYGEVHVAINGKEAVEAFEMALTDSDPYNLVCLDIMMPEMDGHTALEAIRKLEAEAGIHGLDGAKVIMISALSDKKDIMKAFKSQCEAYVVKPFVDSDIVKHLRTFGFAQ